MHHGDCLTHSTEFGVIEFSFLTLSYKLNRSMLILTQLHGSIGHSRPRPRRPTCAALILALVMPAIGCIPMLASTAQAQLAPPSPSPTTPPPALFNRRQISAGAVIPVSYKQADNLTIAPGEQRALALTIPSTIRASNGTLLIPAGSTVEGELVPTGDGTQFVASRLVLTSGQRYSLNATSQVLTQRETVQQGVSPRAVWQGAAAGAGVATIISGLSGDKRITPAKVAIGAGVGAAGGAIFGRKQGEVIVISPNQDFRLTLNAPLLLQ